MSGEIFYVAIHCVGKCCMQGGAMYHHSVWGSIQRMSEQICDCCMQRNLSDQMLTISAADGWVHAATASRAHGGTRPKHRFRFSAWGGGPCKETPNHRRQRFSCGCHTNSRISGLSLKSPLPPPTLKPPPHSWPTYGRPQNAFTFLNIATRSSSLRVSCRCKSRACEARSCSIVCSTSMRFISRTCFVCCDQCGEYQ